MPASVLRLESPQSPRRLRARLELPLECLAVRYPGTLPPDVCATYVACVYAAKDQWTNNFAGAQFTLGRAWYTHLEEARNDDYFAHAQNSDAAVRRAAPGLQERMFAIAAELLDAPVVQREGWCGPGVHVFPRRGEVARRGGEVHFDTEGLTAAQIARRAPAVTFVLMLQPAEIGGGLRVWDRLYEGDELPKKPDPSVLVEQIAYETGELVVIDSYRMHQILPFSGRCDRISATVHAVFDDGRWEAWF
jgi:hypothetical protein